MERIEVIEAAAEAAVDVWNEIYDIDTRRGAALVLGKLLLNSGDEDSDLQQWVGEAVIKGHDGFFS